MNKIVITFCEGPHDVAFLSKILKADGFKTYSELIKKYPYPLNNIFENSLKNMNFSELKIEQVSSKNIPRKVLKKSDTIVLLYAVGGNRQYDKTQTIFESFFDIAIEQSKLSANEIGLMGNDLDNEYEFLFFNDADKSKDDEIQKINEYLQKLLNETTFSISHNEIKEFKNIKIGLYLFSEDENTGALENLLDVLMREDNETIFNKADEYFEANFKTQRVNKKDKINKLKSIITIAGQLQKSGVSQVVTIEQSDYLTIEKLQKSEKSQEIIEFFRGVLAHKELDITTVKDN